MVTIYILVNLFKNAYRNKDLFRLKVHMDLDLYQHIKWESSTVGLIEGIESPRSPSQVSNEFFSSLFDQ